ncbi:MAG: Beta-lactamase precursor [Firmicutes bacterium ADurb.Bin300]|nr:MAG: Beta-lactamase precursor [Firmicutes bacterium ADurb.Bin300]
MEKYNIPRAKTPESVGVSSTEIVEFLRDMEENKLEFHSFMIVRNGKVAAECFRAPFTADTPHAQYSVSKTFTSVAVAFAVDEGFFSLDTLLVDIFPEYVRGKKDKKLEKLTIRHLITMTAGKSVNILADKSKTDWIESFFNCPWYAAPGEEFRYTNENIYMLSAAVKKTTGLSLRDFLGPRLFEPLSIETPFWETDNEGVEAGGWGSYFKTEDLAKLMLCFAGDGKLNGKQILPEGWVKEASAPISDNSFCTDLDAKQGYGYCLWRNGGCKQSYRADGMFSQFGLVFEEYDAVVVVTSGIADEQEARDCIWRHFPKAFIEPHNGKTAIPKLKEILSLSPIDLPAVSGHSPLETKIEGKKIKVRKKIFLNLIGFPVSVMPLAVTYMTTDKAGNFNDFMFSFRENECTVSWVEGDEYNSIVCGMDGHQRYGTMVLGKISYLVCCTALWLNDNELLISIRPVTTVAKRCLRFKFKAGGKVDIFPSSTPDSTDIAYVLANSCGDLIRNTFLHKLAKRALLLIPHLVDSKHRGRITD